MEIHLNKNDVTEKRLVDFVLPFFPHYGDFLFFTFGFYC